MDQQLRISKDVDFSHLQSFELSGFENIATTADPGYILLPRATVPTGWEIRIAFAIRRSS